MTKIFIGGSRRITKLNKKVIANLDNIINDNNMILVGDANGVDKRVQEYLLIRQYKFVMVYCMDDECRNNIGEWEIKKIYSNNKKKDINYYGAKDNEMIMAADYGMLIWDGYSIGTFNNILTLLKTSKKTTIYFSPEKSLYDLSNVDELKTILKSWEKHYMEEDHNVWLGFLEKIKFNQSILDFS